MLLYLMVNSANMNPKKRYNRTKAVENPNIVVFIAKAILVNRIADVLFVILINCVNRIPRHITSCRKA
jgi:hypothetical protein